MRLDGGETWVPLLPPHRCELRDSDDVSPQSEGRILRGNLELLAFGNRERGTVSDVLSSSIADRYRPVSLTNLERCRALKRHCNRVATGRDEKVQHVDVVRIFRGRFDGINGARGEAGRDLRVALLRLDVRQLHLVRRWWRRQGTSSAGAAAATGGLEPDDQQQREHDKAQRGLRYAHKNPHFQ